MKITKTLQRGIQFLNIIRARHRNIPPRSLMVLYLDITAWCDLKCRMCDLWRVKYKDKKLLKEGMSEEHILEVIQDAQELGVAIVGLSGGEPLSNPEIYKYISAINELDMDAHINTNAQRLTKETVEKLIEAGLTCISISIDGSTAETHDYLRGVDGAFDKAIVGLNNVIKYGRGLNIAVNVLINKHNFKDLENIVNLLVSIGVDSIKFMPMNIIFPYNMFGLQDKSLFFNTESDISELEQEIDRLIEILSINKVHTNSIAYLKGIPEYYRRFLGEPKGKDTDDPKKGQKCFAGYLYCVVEANGYVRPCSGIEDNRFNVKTVRFKDLWNSEEFHELRLRALKNQCTGCWEPCYIELNLRGSLLYLLRHSLDVIYELNTYLK